jgi:hypothetical protein
MGRKRKHTRSPTEPPAEVWRDEGQFDCIKPRRPTEEDIQAAKQDKERCRLLAAQLHDAYRRYL